MATDYPIAVQGGRVVSEAEYTEQHSFIEAAGRLLGRVGPPRDAAAGPELRSGLDALAKSVTDKVEATQVAAQSRTLRQRIVVAYGLVLSPESPPSAARGKKLYTSLCASCHGADGVTPAEKARTLRPPPANLREADFVAVVAPYRVFNAITFGVQGTAMAAFDTLTEAERWDIAFHVPQLAHLAHPIRPAAAGDVPAELRESLHLLATEPDRSLARHLRTHGVAPDRTPAALAYLRTRAPYERATRHAPLAEARRLVRESVDAYASGDPERAESLAIDAYLEGFEPAEPALRGRHEALVIQAESAFARLRAAIDRGEGDARVKGEGEGLLALLARAEEASTGARSGAMVFGASLLIVFREGIEVALIITALLSLLTRLERPRAKRDVHFGWISALVAGALTWLLGRELLARAGRFEWLEAAITLLAAAILFSASYWMLSKAESRKWMAYLRRNVESGVLSGGRWSVFGIAFLAAYREAFETALFYEALLQGGGVTAGPVLAGVALGVVLLVAVIFLLLRTAKRLPIGAFFGVSGALLYALSVIFVGKGLHALQATGLLAPRPVGALRVDALGIYPDAVTLGAQIALVLLYGVSYLVANFASRTPAYKSPPAA